MKEKQFFKAIGQMFYNNKLQVEAKILQGNFFLPNVLVLLFSLRITKILSRIWNTGRKMRMTDPKKGLGYSNGKSQMNDYCN